jgi:glutathione S-transferase
MKAGENRQPAYLAINPLGKVPAIRHRGALVTEQVAIFIYLADLFPQAGLAPALNDPHRGPYLRWLAYYAACYEPALVDKAMKREPGPQAMSPYGCSFDTVIGTVLAELKDKPYLLGDKVSAADILWGSALRWGKLFGMLPDTDVLNAYIDRIADRPAVKKAAEIDAGFAAQQAAAAA